MAKETILKILRTVFMSKNVKKEDGFFKKLVSNNSGVSSKSFFLVAVTIIGLILLLVPAVTLIIEIVFTHTIATDLTGMAAYIGAVGTLFLSAGITKAWSEKFEIKEEEITEPTEENVEEERTLGCCEPKSKNQTKVRRFRYKDKRKQ